MELRTEAFSVLRMCDPVEKAAAAQALYQSVQTERFDLDMDTTPSEVTGVPGRPEKPLLLGTLQVTQRSPFTPQGRAALLHAVAHIEMNAINLAADAAWRFAGMPHQYYIDWIKVAAEEGYHFTLLREHLESLGYQYGDFDAHDGLWTMAERTKDDVLARMALVPRTLEARGLDASPPLQAKLARAGDAGAVAILDIILRDEVGHVRIGNHWYRHLCRKRGIDPVAHYPALVKRYDAPKVRPPLNIPARQAAGFTPEELAYLQR